MMFTEYHSSFLPQAGPDEAAFKKRVTDKADEFYYWRLKNTSAMLAAAAAKAKSNDPVELARALEGMKLDTVLVSAGVVTVKVVATGTTVVKLKTTATADWLPALSFAYAYSW